MTLVSAIPLAGLIFRFVGDAFFLILLLIFPIPTMFLAGATVAGIPAGIAVGVAIAEGIECGSRPEQELPALTQSQNPTKEFKTEVESILVTRKSLVGQEVPAIKDAEVNLGLLRPTPLGRLIFWAKPNTICEWTDPLLPQTAKIKQISFQKPAKLCKKTKPKTFWEVNSSTSPRFSPFPHMGKTRRSA